MSKRYPGNYITGNPVALSQSSNAGVWDLKDQYQATGNNTWQEVDGIYGIGRSLRFRWGASPSLTRTPVVTSNTKTCTWSFWVKQSTLATGRIFTSRSGASFPAFGINLMNTYGGTQVPNITIDQYTTGAAIQLQLIPTRLIRDPSAWFNLVVAIDTTQAVASDRVKLYYNGEQITSFSAATYPSQNLALNFNTSGVPEYIGADPANGGYYDGCMAETHKIDGQQLDASYFGYFDSITNIWQPKRYTGTHGTNGYYLPFNDIYNVYGLGNDKKETTSLGVYTSGALTTSESKWGGSAFAMTQSNLIFPGGYGSGYGIDNAMHNVDGKDFTIEFWYKGTAAQTNFGATDGVLTGYNYFCSKGRTNTASNGWGIHLYSNGAVGWETFGASGGNSGSVQASVNVLDNNWHHIAITRASGTVRIFIDGTLSVTQSLNFTCNNTYGLLINGMWNYSAGDSVNYRVGGTMDDFRMYTGIAKYTSSFAAPTQQLPIGQGDQYWGYVSCALPFDGINGSTQIPCWIPNYWTPANLSLTAGITYDSSVDSPTNVFTQATDIGGVVPGNYPTIDPLEPLQSYITYSNANLSYAQSAAAGFGPQAMTKATFQLPKTGKWVWAVTIGSAGNNSQMGIARPDYAGNPTRAQYGTTIVTTDYAVMNPTGGVVKNGTEISTSSAINIGDELQCAVDCDAGTVSWYRNGTYLGQATGMPTTTNDYWPMTFGGSSSSSGSGSYNFGQRPFAYAPPAGFKTLNTTNLQALGDAAVGKAAIQANKWMEATSYSGDAVATGNKIVNAGKFAPDLVWLRRTGSNGNHHLSDIIRGAGRVVYPNLTNIEASDPGVTAFNSDGFTVTGNGNELSRQIAWQWKQSPTSGFNIISYTGTGVARGISHNLGIAPRFMIVKQRDVAVRSWAVYHAGLTNPQSAFYLDSVGAPFAYTAFFNNQAPDSNNIYLGTDPTVNQSGSNYIGYVWSEVPGFSKFGSYMGTNSSNGPIVYTGFKPKWILIRESALSSGNSRDWLIFDSARTPYNGYSTSDTSAGAVSITQSAPYTGTPGYSDAIDFLSNGFKLKNAGSPNYNNASSFVYAAFAESPFALNNRAI